MTATEKNRENLESIKKEKERWTNEIVKKSLEKVPERKRVFKTLSNLEVNSLYTPEDLEDFLVSQENTLILVLLNPQVIVLGFGL